MGLNADGSARCDRCGIWLAGYGVIYGMVCSDLDIVGAPRSRIYCYVNNCRGVVLAGMVNHADENRCTDDGTALTARSVSEAMLCTDLRPGADPPTIRQMQFCYATGSRDRLVAKAEGSL